MAHIFITDSDFAGTDSSFEYLLWFQPSLWAMILREDELIVLLDARYFLKTKNIDKDKIRNILTRPELIVRYELFTDISQGIISQLTTSDEIVLEDNIAIKYYKNIWDAFQGNKLKFESAYLDDIKIIKTSLEKTAIKKAISIIDEVFIYIEDLVSSQKILWMTELSLRQLIIAKIFELWGQWESFESIVAFWKNSAVPHHLSGNTVIEDWVLLIDMGAKYDNYCSDFTRTIWVWEKNDQFHLFQKAHKIVKTAHETAVNEYTVGMTWWEVDTLARDIIQDSEYKDLFSHSLWHWLGLDIHEMPRLKKWDKTVLLEGMVFTIEPGIYIEEEFWIRLEDIVFLENWKLIKYTQVNL